jgi:hypothetical protein
VPAPVRPGIGDGGARRRQSGLVAVELSLVSLDCFVALAMTAEFFETSLRGAQRRGNPDWLPSRGRRHLWIASLRSQLSVQGLV